MKKIYFALAMLLPISIFSQLPIPGDEIFINGGKDIVYNIFDQNRILIGPAFKLNDQFTFTFTYNGKYAALNLPSEFTYNHIFWLAIRHNLDLSKSATE